MERKISIRFGSTARAFAQNNLEDASFQIADADIEIGRFDPATIYSSVSLLNDGTFDAVRVTLRRDGSTNPLVPLFFARALGRDSSAVTASATAVLQKAELLLEGADVLPFATPKDLWDSMAENGSLRNAHGMRMETENWRMGSVTRCPVTGARSTSA